MTDSSRRSTDAETGGPLGGERLAAARRAHEISATDIARELHLDERKVRALEQNDFAILGAPVFAKGHLRKYAELVGVPVDDVIADYYKMNRSTGAPPVVGPARMIQRDRSPGPWIAWAVIILIVLGIAYWLVSRGTAVSLTQEAPAGVTAFVAAPGNATREDEPGETAESASATGIAEPVLPTARAAPAAKSNAGSGAEHEISSLVPQVQVELAFSGECWTEVTDASGRILFYDLGKEGTAVTLAGDEPLSIILGDFENVSIAVEGRDYPIPDAAHRGRMARFTINRQ